MENTNDKLIGGGRADIDHSSARTSSGGGYYSGSCSKRGTGPCGCGGGHCAREGTPARATGANDKQAPAGAVKMPEPDGAIPQNSARGTVMNEAWDQDSMQAYGAARAEEARREADEHINALAQIAVAVGADSGGAAGIVAAVRKLAQRAAGGDDLEQRMLAEQAGAWRLVFETLQEVAPGWLDHPSPTGAGKADAVIRALAQRPPAASAAVPGVDQGSMTIGAPDYRHVFAEHCERDGYPSDDADTQAMLWKFFTYGMAAAQPVEEAAAQADGSALFNGFDIAKLPPILISCVAKLWPGSSGLFWESALEKMPERIEQLVKQAAAAPTAQPTPKENAPDLEGRGGDTSAPVGTSAEESSLAQPTPPDVELPPLPEPRAIRAGHGFQKVYALGYTADMVKEYARAALRHPPVPNVGELVTGMQVSVDVSTGDDDATNRYFGTVDLVQECESGKHGLILLVQNPKPNFEAAPNPDAEDAACPACNGTGESEELVGGGPDAHMEPCTCPHCEGNGDLFSAYQGVVKLLDAEREKYTKFCGQVYMADVAARAAAATGQAGKAGA